MITLSLQSLPLQTRYQSFMLIFAQYYFIVYHFVITITPDNTCLLFKILKLLLNLLFFSFGLNSLLLLLTNPHMVHKFLHILSLSTDRKTTHKYQCINTLNNLIIKIRRCLTTNFFHLWLFLKIWRKIISLKHIVQLSFVPRTQLITISHFLIII